MLKSLFTPCPLDEFKCDPTPFLSPSPTLLYDPISYTSCLSSTISSLGTLPSPSPCHRPRFSLSSIYVYIIYTYISFHFLSPTHHYMAFRGSLASLRSRAKSVCVLSVQKTTAKFSYLRQLPIYSNYTTPRYY